MRSYSHAIKAQKNLKAHVSLGKNSNEWHDDEPGFMVWLAGWALILPKFLAARQGAYQMLEFGLSSLLFMKCV
jgi:hypothetical protein